jgi:hypothetical protein
VTRMTEIEDASKNSKLLWNVGNHDQRLWRYIRVNAPEVSGMANTDLFDYFGRWKQTYAVDINGNTLIKHDGITAYTQPITMLCGLWERTL